MITDVKFISIAVDCQQFKAGSDLVTLVSLPGDSSNLNFHLFFFLRNFAQLEGGKLMARGLYKNLVTHLVMLEGEGLIETQDVAIAVVKAQEAATKKGKQLQELDKNEALVGRAKAALEETSLSLINVSDQLTPEKVRKVPKESFLKLKGEEGEGEQGPGVQGKGALVLVQTKSKYKWPGLIVGSNGTQWTIQLFDKEGLNGRTRIFEADAVQPFVYTAEMDEYQLSTNCEVRQAYSTALKIMYGME